MEDPLRHRSMTPNADMNKMSVTGKNIMLLGHKTEEVSTKMTRFN